MLAIKWNGKKGLSLLYIVHFKAISSLAPELTWDKESVKTWMKVNPDSVLKRIPDSRGFNRNIITGIGRHVQHSPLEAIISLKNLLFFCPRIVNRSCEHWFNYHAP